MRTLRGRPRSLHAPLPSGTHLPRRLHRQLVPRCQTAISDLEVVYDEHKATSGDPVPSLNDQGQESGEYSRRHHAPETCSATAPSPSILTTSATRTCRQKTPPAAHRPRDSHRSRRLGQPRLRHGAVKVTPPRSNDFALGQRHHLPSINIMDETAHINNEGGAYKGLDRYVAASGSSPISKPGLLRDQGSHPQHRHCDRCKTVVEPRLSTQWFVAVNKPTSERGASMAGSPRCRQRRPYPVHSGDVQEDLSQLDGEHLRLVYLAQLCGAIASRVALRRLPPDHCAAARRARSYRLRPLRLRRNHAGDRRPRHLVLFWSAPVSVFGWPNFTGSNSAHTTVPILSAHFSGKVGDHDPNLTR